MNQAVDLNSYTYPHCLTALSAAERIGDPVLCAELHRDAGPKAVRLGDVAGGQEHLEKARSIFAFIGDRGGEANTLRNLATLPAVPRRAALGYLREAVALVQHDEGLQVLHVARVSLAGMLTTFVEEKPTKDDCLEAVKLLEQSLPVIRRSDWAYLIPIASVILADALTLLSRPREALEVASGALEFAGSDPSELGLLLRALAEAAFAAGEHPVAADACREYRKLSERHGPDHLDDLMVQQTTVGYEHASAAIHRVEEALIHIGARPRLEPHAT